MNFEDLDLAEPLLRAIKKEGYTTPMPIQEQAIPHALAGCDILGCAQTGTGKTAAFALPILQRLSKGQSRKHGHHVIRALVLTPTRELASQIGDSFRDYGSYLELRSTLIFGGVRQSIQTQALHKGVDILVATPGRLLDLMGQGLINLRGIETFVLDEADRMLDMGFIPDVRRIVEQLPKKRQTLFFSATMPSNIVRLAGSIVKDPIRVEVTPSATTVESVNQQVYFVESSNKSDLLLHLLKEDKSISRALIFTRTKHGADHLAQKLKRAGVKVQIIHGNRTQAARERALERFKSGQSRLLIATDIAARGIDIESISHVFNYCVPDEPEVYVHRIGRTGRAGAGGSAITFCDFEEMAPFGKIEKLIHKQLLVINDHPYRAFLSARPAREAEDGPPAPRPKRGRRPLRRTTKRRLR